MTAKKTSSAAVAAEPKIFRVKLARSVPYHGTNLNPRDEITVSEDVLAELGDAVLEATEIPNVSAV